MRRDEYCPRADNQGGCRDRTQRAFQRRYRSPSIRAVYGARPWAWQGCWGLGQRGKTAKRRAGIRICESKGRTTRPQLSDVARKWGAGCSALRSFNHALQFCKELRSPERCRRVRSLKLSIGVCSRSSLASSESRRSRSRLEACNGPRHRTPDSVA